MMRTEVPKISLSTEDFMVSAQAAKCVTWPSFMAKILSEYREAKFISCITTITVRPSSSAAARSWRIICTERSEEHTSELQSRGHLVCRLLLEKKNKIR